MAVVLVFLLLLGGRIGFGFVFDDLVTHKTVLGTADELKDHTVSSIHSFEERFVVRYIRFAGEPELGIEVFRSVRIVTTDFCVHGDSVAYLDLLAGGIGQLLFVESNKPIPAEAFDLHPFIRIGKRCLVKRFVGGLLGKQRVIGCLLLTFLCKVDEVFRARVKTGDGAVRVGKRFLKVAVRCDEIDRKLFVAPFFREKENLLAFLAAGHIEVVHEAHPGFGGNRREEESRERDA